ncbi:MAG: acyl-CoA dehydrogenase family protein [Rhodothermales bacterium]
MSLTSYLPETLRTVDFNAFIDEYKSKLRNLFDVRANLNQLSLKRGLPPFVMREIQSKAPLSVFISEEYGGRGGHVHECLSMLEASSYESLPLSLTMGINGALFLQPVGKYGTDAMKERVLGNFVDDKRLGGLMITEPDYGSDALSMQTNYTCTDGKYHLKGTKHWAGLTGWADYWLLTARRRDANGNLSRDIDFFVADNNLPGQQIHVEEYYENLGLYMIPYGRNSVNVQLPADQKLQPKSTGIKMMLDILHRSRLQFPGMGMGFLRRMLDEAVDHCRERMVGSTPLFNYDQVKERLARLQAWYTTCSAMCAFTTETASVDNDLAKSNVSANAIKTVVTDMMQDASQSLLQLSGAMGYRVDHIAGRSTVDSRPFQIFEGANDILYQQISEAILKSMRRMKEANVYEYLKTYNLTERAADYFKETLNFNVDAKMPQRKLVELGEVLGRVISMDFTIRLGERGFHADLINNALAVMKQDVDTMITRFNTSRLAAFVDDYSEDSSWLAYVPAAK